MWSHLYSDAQLERMQREAKQEVASTKEPLHPNYGDTVTRRNAEDAVRETTRALEDRRK